MDTNLLSLFDNIETKPVNLIPADDMTAVETIWNAFLVKFNDLHNLWVEFTARDKENTEDPYRMGANSSYSFISKPGHSLEWEMELKRLSFSFKFDILHIEKLINELCNMVEYHICKYFNQKYSCSLDTNHCLADSLFTKEGNRYTGTTPDLQTILDAIIRENDGLSFEEKGKRDSKMAIGNEIKYKTVSQNGKTVCISRAVDTSWQYIRARDVSQILSYVAYCFFGNYGLFYILPRENQLALEDMEMGVPMEITNQASRIEQIKIFKNGKLNIKFRKIEDATLFYNFINEAKAMAKAA